MRRALPLLLAALAQGCDFTSDATAYREAYCARVCAAAAPECAVHCDGGIADSGMRDAGAGQDAGLADGGPVDAGADGGGPDSGSADAGAPDAGGVDAGSVDAGSVDAGSADAGSADAGSADAGSADAGSADAGSVDAGSVDGGPWLVQLTSPGPFALTALAPWGEGAVFAGRGGSVWLQDQWLPVDAGAQSLLVVRVDGAGSVAGVRRLTVRATADFDRLLLLPQELGFLAVGTVSGAIDELPSLGVAAGTDVLLVGFGPDLAPRWAHRLGGASTDRVIGAWLESPTSAQVAMTLPAGGSSAGVTVSRGTAVVRVRFDGGLEHVEHFPEVLLGGMAQLGAARLVVGEALADGGSGGLFPAQLPGSTYFAVSDGGAGYQLVGSTAHDGLADLDCSLVEAGVGGALVGCAFDDDAPARLRVGAVDAGPTTAFVLELGGDGQLRSLTALPRRIGVIPSLAGSFETAAGRGYAVSDLPLMGEDEARYVFQLSDGGFDESVHALSVRRVVGHSSGSAFVLGVLRSGPATRAVFPGLSVSYDGGYRAIATRVRLP